jgi:hypothetical protein
MVLAVHDGVVVQQIPDRDGRDEAPDLERTALLLLLRSAVTS